MRRKHKINSLKKFKHMTDSYAKTVHCQVNKSSCPGLYFQRHLFLNVSVPVQLFPPLRMPVYDVSYFQCQIKIHCSTPNGTSALQQTQSNCILWSCKCYR